MILSKENQGITLTIYTQDENGTPIPNTRIKLYMLTEKGKKLLSETTTDESGTAIIHIIIPRKYVVKDPITKKPIYASINLEVVAGTKGMSGGLIFPVDPLIGRVLVIQK